MTIQPTSDRILVRLAAAQETMRDGILIPASAANHEVQRATVIAIGPKVDLLKVGDTILLGHYRATEIKVDGESFALLTQEDALAVVESE